MVSTQRVSDAIMGFYSRKLVGINGSIGPLSPAIPSSYISRVIAPRDFVFLSTRRGQYDQAVGETSSRLFPLDRVAVVHFSRCLEAWEHGALPKNVRIQRGLSVAGAYTTAADMLLANATDAQEFPVSPEEDIVMLIGYCSIVSADAVQATLTSRGCNFEAMTSFSRYLSVLFRVSCRIRATTTISRLSGSYAAA